MWVEPDINLHWKIGRVVECTGLENQRTARYRRFESYIFRKKIVVP